MANMPNVLPPIPTGLRASYFGDSGGSTDRYYWVRANYGYGQSNLAGPVKVTTPAALSKANVVLLTWNPSPTALSYDVIQTTSSTYPTGTASILNASGVDRNSYTDAGDTLAAYFVNPITIVGAGRIRVATAKYNFAVDGGAQGAITPAITSTIPKDALVIGGTLNVPTALASGGSATIAVGTTAGSAANSIKTATAVASYSTDAVLIVTCQATPFKMTADGSINITIAAADLITSGILEIYVFYIMSSLD